MRSNQLKIAIISEDGKTISQHFGRAPLYVVVTVDEGKVVGRETRPKAGHHSFAQGETHEETGGRHGFDAASQDKHAQMAAPLGDCQVLIAGGMGMGAYESLRSYDVQPIVTDLRDIDQAVGAYVAGTLANRMERLH
jgi:predicted Fe-Mo cluster-binding NifX family protein